MAKKKAPNHNAPIHFRPGPSYGQLLSKYAEELHISRNEVARRLGLLAANSLHAGYYLPIARLADFLGGGQEFEQATGRVHALLGGSDWTRMELGPAPLGEQERINFVDRWVTSHITGEPMSAPLDPVRRIRRDLDDKSAEPSEQLATLVAWGLTGADYPAVERLARNLGGVNSFFQAAKRARDILNIANFSRSELGMPQLNEQERTAYLDRWVERFLSGEQPQTNDELQPIEGNEAGEGVARKIRRPEDVIGSQTSPATEEVCQPGRPSAKHGGQG